MVYRIYRVTNLLTRAAYIGATGRSIQARWKDHQRSSSGVKRLKNDICKYGEDNFYVEELCLCPTRKVALVTEATLIRKFRTIYPRGYNLLVDGNIPKPHSRATKRRIATAMKGNQYGLGYKHTSKARSKMRIAQTGRKHSAKTKQRMRKWHLGKTFSAESREKMRQVALRRKFSKETRLKMSKAHVGKPWSTKRRAVWRKAAGGYAN